MSIEKKLIINAVIINYNTIDLTMKCIDMLKKALDETEHRIIVIDNNSKDGSQQNLKTIDDIVYIQNGANIGFARAANQGIFYRSDYEYCLMVNSDAFPTKEALIKMIDHMNKNSDCAVLGPQLINEDQSKQNSISHIPNLLSEIISKHILAVFDSKNYFSKRKKIGDVCEVPSLIGAFLMMRRDAVQEVGGYDERYYFFMEETDLCFQLKKKGYQIMFHPHVNIVHSQGETARKNPLWSKYQMIRSKYQFFYKWYGQKTLIILYRIQMMKFFLKGGVYSILSFLTLMKNKKLIEKMIYSFVLFKKHFSSFSPYIILDQVERYKDDSIEIYSNDSKKALLSIKNVFQNTNQSINQNTQTAKDIILLANQQKVIFKFFNQSKDKKNKISVSKQYHTHNEVLKVLGFRVFEINAFGLINQKDGSQKEFIISEIEKDYFQYEILLKALKTQFDSQQYEILKENMYLSVKNLIIKLYQRHIYIKEKPFDHIMVKMCSNDKNQIYFKIAFINNHDLYFSFIGSSKYEDESIQNLERDHSIMI